MDGFLKEIRHATHGQTPLQRRLAIVACAKHRAAELQAATPEIRHETTRAQLLKSSIQSKLPILLLCAAVIVAGILFAVYLL